MFHWLTFRRVPNKLINSYFFKVTSLNPAYCFQPFKFNCINQPLPVQQDVILMNMPRQTAWSIQFVHVFNIVLKPTSYIFWINIMIPSIVKLKYWNKFFKLAYKSIPANKNCHKFSSNRNISAGVFRFKTFIRKPAV